MLLLLMTFDDPASISFVFRSLLMLLLLLLVQLLLPLPGRSGCWHTPLTTAATVSADSAVSLFLYWVDWVVLSIWMMDVPGPGCCVWTGLLGGWWLWWRWLFLDLSLQFLSCWFHKRCRKCVLSCFVITSLFLNTFFLCFNTCFFSFVFVLKQKIEKIKLEITIALRIFSFLFTFFFKALSR